MVAHACPDSLSFYAGRNTLIFLAENVPSSCHVVLCDVSYVDIKEHRHMAHSKKPHEN